VVRAWSKCSKTNAAATIVPIRHGSWDAAWPACSQGDPRRAPSSQGNRPLATDRLRQRISNLGLRNILPARNGALATLASQVPPALLADQIGPFPVRSVDLVEDHRRRARRVRRTAKRRLAPHAGPGRLDATTFAPASRNFSPTSRQATRPTDVLALAARLTGLLVRTRSGSG
jgi:hypothetical protein